MIELLFAFVVWAVLHSFTAGPRAKAAYRQRFGERAYRGTYRIIYNLISGLTLVPVIYLLATRLPEVVIWSVPMPFRILNYILQITGALGLLVALLQTDIGQFLGVRQLLRYLRGEPDPDPAGPFIAGGAYGVVRHPLYLFSLVFLWANPVMSLSSLALNLWVTLYFIIGSIFEERRLVYEFGDTYRQYQSRVPRLIPLRLPVRQHSSDGT